MMCPSSTPLSFIDWTACIVQTLRASTFTSSIFFNSSVDPPRKRRNKLWDIRMSDVPMLLMVGWVALSVLWLGRAVGFVVWRGKMFLSSSRCGYRYGVQQTSCSVGTSFVYIGCIGWTWRWSVLVYGWSPASISMCGMIRFYNASFLPGKVAKMHFSFISYVCWSVHILHRTTWLLLDEFSLRFRVMIFRNSIYKFKFD